MKISIAQMKSVKGDITANVNRHAQFIRLAASLEADALFFPELSLTGYEPLLARDLAIDQNDPRLDDFHVLSNQYHLTIGLGVPTKTASGTLISMIIFQPYQLRNTYSKQLLHSDELPYFESGKGQLILSVHDKMIAPAICYESLQHNHAEKAYLLGAQVYLASVAKSQNGVDKGITHYAEVAWKHSIPVLMVNSVGYCDNFMSVGNSSIWNSRGNLVAQMDDHSEGIMVFNLETEEVTRAIVK